MGGWRFNGVLVAGLLLAGCGGGGGGGGTADPAPPVGADERAVLSAAQADRAAGLTLRSAGVPLLLAQQLSEELLALHDERVPERTQACPATPNGRLERRWTDADGDRKLSAGDQLEWRIVRCARDAWLGDPEATGLLRVRVTRVDAMPDWGVAGSVEFAEPLVAPRLLSGAVGTQLAGSFDFDSRSAGDTLALVARASGRDDLQIETPASGERRALRGFALAKTLRMAAARIEHDWRGRIVAAELGGAIDFVTPAPLRSWLDTWPERHAGQGGFELRGRGPERVRVGAGPGSGPEWALEFDRGDGSAPQTSAAAWAERVDSFLFRDPRSRVLTNPRPFDPDELWDLPIYNRAGALRSGQPLRLQFSRPIEAAGFPRDLILRSLDAEGPGIAEQRELTYELRIDGALVSFVPREPLRWASTVRLVPTVGAAPLELRSRTGRGTLRSLGLINFGSFIEPRVLAGPEAPLGLLVPGTAVLLDGRRSAYGIVSWRWSQVSGPAVELADPQAATTEIRLAPGAVGVGTVRVRLTVADILGQSSSRDLELTSFVPGTVPSLMRLRRVTDAGPFFDRLWVNGRLGSLDATASGSGVFASFRNPMEPFPDATLAFDLASGGTIATGRYTLAAMAMAPLLSIGGTETLPGCSGAGEVRVHQLRRGPGGELLELALDSERDCSPAIDRERFSLRFNSHHPLPP